MESFPLFWCWFWWRLCELVIWNRSPPFIMKSHIIYIDMRRKKKQGRNLNSSHEILNMVTKKNWSYLFRAITDWNIDTSSENYYNSSPEQELKTNGENYHAAFLWSISAQQLILPLISGLHTAPCASLEVNVLWVRLMLDLANGSIDVNPFTVGNLLFWENFLLPECLRDSIVWRWTKFILAIDDQS